MNVAIFASTEFCKERILNGKSKELPWYDLKPGLSFAVPVSVVNELSFRSMVSAASKRDGRTYKCIKSEDKNWFEVTVLGNESPNISFTIGEISPYMQALIDNKPIIISKMLQDIPDGKCATVTIGSVVEETLRTACSLWSRKLKRKLICHKHVEFGVFEVANLTSALTENKAVFFDPSEQMLSKVK